VKKLLDTGAISQAEYDNMKVKPRGRWTRDQRASPCGHI
jgi:hypothetical protein